MKYLDKIFKACAILVSTNFLLMYFTIGFVCDTNHNMKVSGEEMQNFPIIDMWALVSTYSIVGMALFAIIYLCIKYRNL